MAFFVAASTSACASGCSFVFLKAAITSLNDSASASIDTLNSSRTSASRANESPQLSLVLHICLLAA